LAVERSEGKGLSLSNIPLEVYESLRNDKDLSGSQNF